MSQPHRWRRLWTRWAPSRPRLLLYQMGKVGSQTLEATLRESALPHRIWRGHFLSPTHQKLFSTYLERTTVPKESKESLRAQLAEAQSLYGEIEQRRRAGASRGKRKLEVVAAVREPVGIMLASICQNFSNYFTSVSEITAEACRNLFLEAGTVDEARRQQVRDLSCFIHGWFDLELQGVLGIDVFSVPFEHGKGCAIYENDLARVLVYRYEDFGRLRSMLELFLGRRLAGWVNRNIGSQKDYGAAYEEVKKKLKLPRGFLAQQYDSPFVRHFYSQEERDRMSLRWGL